ncbi:MAG: winged helix-turn-helix domain-containing protein [Gammaproteobacteria bacterium]|nr:winged helix-turn-helix domain-containing protein [Gammaproteobacteria bacterium]
MDSRPYSWTFLSNYAHVLVCLAADPDARIRDIAAKTGITERAAIRIVAHLEEAGIVSREKSGRRNRYLIHTDKPLRHPLESHRTVGALIEMVLHQGAG